MSSIDPPPPEQSPDQAPETNQIPPLPKIRAKPPSQKTIDGFWKNFSNTNPSKALAVLPNNPYARIKAVKVSKSAGEGEPTVKTYEQARDDCVRDVNRIIKECRRVNQKYRDPYFDLEIDLKVGKRDCLDGLCDDSELTPKGVRRVPDIFDKPQFFVDGASTSDVKQGVDGDCWLMAALASLGCNEELISRVCVARDEKVGVYGFVFYHDGEWEQCIIDDKLYLHAPDFDEITVDYLDEEEYKKTYQTGSKALYFAACSDQNETWLPLLEKAYAKAHGDYWSIEGGFMGEAVEDLTGGVTSEIFSSDILDRDLLWSNELLKVNKEFLFSASTGQLSNWLWPDRPTGGERKGIFESHAYSVLDAREVDGIRLLKVRNPWGNAEWTGPWSDGSKEWTPEWMTKLDHRFGDDGIFWISYNDFLGKYSYLNRTRLFDESWKTKQRWTSLNVPWSADYHSTKFTITITAPETPVVIVLSQLDQRYFRGLEGEYEFRLQFRVERQGADEDDYIVRTHGHCFMSRSVSTDITLDAGTYDVFVKIVADRNPGAEPMERVVRRQAVYRREKLVQIGRAYDMAHARGRVVETEAEKKAKKEKKAEDKVKERAKLRTKLEEQKRKEWNKMKKSRARENRATRKEETIRALREAKKAKEEGGNADGEADTPDNQEAEKTDDVSTVKQEPTPEPEKTVEGASTEVGGEAKEKEGEHVEEVKGDENGDYEKIEKAEGNEADSKEVAAKAESAVEKAAPSAADDVASPADGDDAASTISDAASFHSFEFDSDLDMPTESESESEVDDDEQLDSEGAATKDNADGDNGNEDDDGDFAADDDDDEAPKDETVITPWNAVCVTGLRVYSKDEGLKLEVVRPSPQQPSTSSASLQGAEDGRALTRKIEQEEGEEKGKETVVGAGVGVGVGADEIGLRQLDPDEPVAGAVPDGQEEVVAKSG